MRATLLCLTCAALSACGPGPGIHRGGIISLAPSLTETVIALGAGTELSGVTRYCELPPGGPELPRLGTLFEPDYERIASLEPRLVLSTRTGEEEERRRAFERLSLRCVFFNAETIADVIDTVRGLGELLGRSGRAEELARSIEAEVRRWRRRRLAPVPVAFVVDHPPFVAVPGSFAHEMLELAGGVNVFADLAGPKGYRPVEAEAILERAPEVILDCTWLGPGDPGRHRREIIGYWNKLPGLEARIVPFEQIRPGPRIAAWVQAIAAAIRPEE